MYMYIQTNKQTNMLTYIYIYLFFSLSPTHTFTWRLPCPALLMTAVSAVVSSKSTRSLRGGSHDLERGINACE